MRIVEINKVALYYSKLSELEISLEEQKKRLERYCRHFGLEVVKEYVEVDNVNKPLFKQLIEDIKSKEFNIVLSYNFDTLSKNDNDLRKLINQLYYYKCELQLESTYEYIPVPKPLFKIPRREIEEEQPIKKKNSGLLPMFIEYELQNPKLKEPFDWVKKFDEDNIRFEENIIFNDDGEYLGITRDIFVKFKEFKGCYRPKKKSKQAQLKMKPLW